MTITFCGYTSDQIKRMADEIERLRAALKELASDAYHDDDYQVIARRALEGTSSERGPPKTSQSANNTIG